eukprot:scaffold1237_cov243-Pinguiococcus_pyrenoidosus.AAC.51
MQRLLDNSQMYRKAAKVPRKPLLPPLLGGPGVPSRVVRRPKLLEVIPARPRRWSSEGKGELGAAHAMLCGARDANLG